MGPIQAIRVSLREAKRPRTPEEREQLRKATEGRSELGFLASLIRQAPLETPDKRTDERR